MIVADTYRILRLLGRGGMGSVWLARDTKLHRDVALKLVDHAAWGGRDAREVFLREARAMAQVQHPHVVTIHAFGDHCGTPYFVMEYIPGASLERLLSIQGQALAFDQAIGILDQICRGVEAVHRAGALHCDIKPANVLIGPSFRVAVADLGLARTVGERPATQGGTPGYVAPEIIRDDGRVPDERADIYAVGALAYRLLTRSSAFASESVADTLQKQLDGDLLLPSVAGEVPEVFDDILVRALSRDPDERQPSAEALRRELGAARDALPRTYHQTTVFVVDDDPDLCEHARRLILRAMPRVNVRVYPDGRRALDAVEREGLPDVAVLDLEMPDINGVELTAALKSQPGGGQVEVVMLTGAGSARDWELLQRLGASGFLSKPVDESELSALMRRLAVPDER
jgi:serine/threonine-protein kinase